MGKLYVVSTPIGNLEDISLRALRILKEVDLILCEDTRKTKKLLDHYKISKPTISYHQHSQLTKINYILDQLKQGKKLALVSEAGTPGISDPGNKLISFLVDKFISQKNQNLLTYSQAKGRAKLTNSLTIIPIPGPCAAITALSISGLPADKFLFLGFPPSKRKRKKFFQEVANSKYTVVFYESPHRILRTLEELNLELQVIILRMTSRRLASYKLQVVVCRELTKKFESIYRGQIEEVINQIKEDKIKGEFVVIIGNE